MISDPTQNGRDHAFRKALIACIALAAAILLVYWPVQTFDFVNYDDTYYVTANPQVQQGLTLEGIRWSFGTFMAANWHPLTWISHMIDFEFYRFNAGGHHWNSLQIHLVNTLLLFVVLRFLTGALWSSAAVAGLFGLHPLHVESVAWIAERKDLLSGFFWILAMGLYGRYVKVPNVPRYLLVGAALALGLLSKPMVVTLPFVLLLLDYWPISRWDSARTVFDPWFNRSETFRNRPLLRLAAEKVPLLFLVAGSCVATLLAQKAGNAMVPLEMVPLDVRVGNAVVSYGVYIRKMFWPDDLAMLYTHMGMPALWKIAASGVLLVALTCLAVAQSRARPYLLVGWFWFLGTLVPVIGIVQVGSQALADRYTYLPLIGLFIVIVWGMKSIFDAVPPVRWPMAALTAVCMIALMLLSRAQVQTWENNFTLYEQALRVTEVNPVAHNNLGAAYFAAGSCEKAIPHFQKALAIKRDYADPLINLGVCAVTEGKSRDALDYFRRAIEINPRETRVRMSLGILLMEQGFREEAEREFRQVLAMNPKHEAAHHHLGVVLLEQERLAEAYEHLRTTTQINPRNGEALNNVGVTLLKQGKREDALGFFRRALLLEPGNAVYEQNMRAAGAVENP